MTTKNFLDELPTLAELPLSTEVAVACTKETFGTSSDHTNVAVLKQPKNDTTSSLPGDYTAPTRRAS